VTEASNRKLVPGGWIGGGEQHILPFLYILFLSNEIN
jgi:hypothetical protein